jgi:hypothetical protein
MLSSEQNEQHSVSFLQSIRSNIWDSSVNTLVCFEMWGSNGNEDVYVDLTGCRQAPKFRRNTLPSSSVLQVHTTPRPRTSISTCLRSGHRDMIPSTSTGWWWLWSCRWGDTTSLNCGHQLAYRSFHRWYMSMEMVEWHRQGKLLIRPPELSGNSTSRVI